MIKQKFTVGAKVLLVVMCFLMIAMTGCDFGLTFHDPEGDSEPQNTLKEQKELFGTNPLSEYIPGYVEQITDASSSFQCTLKNGRWASGGFQAWEGQEIAIALFPGENVSLQVGILDPTGWLHYVSGSGDLAHTFQVEQTGAYHLVIYSETTEPVEVMGIYYTRGEDGVKQPDIKELSLFSYRNGEYSEELTAEAAYEKYQEICGEIADGTTQGILYEGLFPEKEEWEKYRFAYYMAVQDVGDACAISLHVITVYDGITERFTVAWLEDQPKAWKEYKVLGIQMPLKDFSEGMFIVGASGFSVGFQAPQDEETVKHLDRFGFRLLEGDWKSYMADICSYEADYHYNGHFDGAVMDSVFTDDDRNQEFMKTVWDQLSEDQRKIVKGSWKDGKIRRIEGGDRYSYHIQMEDTVHEEYYNKELYLVSYHTTSGPAIEYLRVAVEPESWQIIGCSHPR